ncbi:uncharacterized protein LOC131858764 [Cryptomeria japonica]|uniref:uncharacterized protein LOC131858764 n=1 Tax=Cryptomeria japonica TaxID=3369 RepID=UPI0025AB8169|nr:uncharacterized protein LOC131858764 [Cryptomeria japonica]
MGLEIEPAKDEDKPKWLNKCDEAYGTLCLSVSPDLLFHIESLNLPNEIWKKLETLFGTQDSMRGHMLENELISLSPGSSSSTIGAVKTALHDRFLMTDLGLLHYSNSNQSKYALDLLLRFHMADCIEIDLVGYTDLDWAGDSQDHKSTLGYSFSLGSGLVCWLSKKQSTIALSSTEA